MLPALESRSDDLVARAATSAYIALSGIWFIFGGLYLVLAHYRPKAGACGVVALCTAIGFLWVVWLRGFRLTLSDGILEYRDGFYRVTRVKLDDIIDVKNTWVRNSRMPIPRLSIKFRPENAELLINVKPFQRYAIRAITDRLTSNL